MTAGSAGSSPPRRCRPPSRSKAGGHTILVGLWHLLAEGTTEDERRSDYFDRCRSPAITAHRKLSDLRALGWDVTINSIGTVTAVPPPA